MDEESAPKKNSVLKAAAYTALMIIPADVLANVVTYLLETMISAYYKGANRQPDSTYHFLVEFGLHFVGATLFIWICTMPQKQIRWISTWVLAAGAILCAFALESINVMSNQSAWGQTIGVLITAAFFWRKDILYAPVTRSSK